MTVSFNRPNIHEISDSPVRDLLDVSFENANGLVRRLAAHGILHEMTGQCRNRHFVYAPYVALFSDL
jgi:hypothetical protein